MRISKEPGAAHSGVDDWYWQRLSAVVLVLLMPMPFFILAAVYTGFFDQAALVEMIGSIITRLFHTLLILALTIHGYMGMKVIFEDYVHQIGWRVTMIGGTLLAMSAVGIWWLSIIWSWGG